MDGSDIVQKRGDFKEGFDVRNVLRELSDRIEYETVVDFGCGFGRLCQAFDPRGYIGVDIDPHSIHTAKKQFAEYRFAPVQEEPHFADLYLAYDVFLYMDDQTLHEALRKMRCKWLIVGEMLGRNWRKSQVPPTFHRELSDYLSILRSHDLILQDHVKHPFKKYAEAPWYQDRSTDLSFLVFKKCFREAN